jgi:hypothetical protein
VTLILAAVVSGAVAAPVAPQYYIRLRPVELAPSAIPPAPVDTKATAPGTDSAADGGAQPEAVSVVALARDNLLEALRKRPEVVLELNGIATDAPAAAVAAELKRRNLKGYEVTLRILRQDHSVRPPPAGRRFRLLEQNVKLALVGTLYPGEPTLALGGDGESTVQIEVGAQISENQQREVLVDALKDAVQQAVDQSLRKLLSGPMKPPKDPPKRRK